jgi:hypothetical protein
MSFSAEAETFGCQILITIYQSSIDHKDIRKNYLFKRIVNILHTVERIASSSIANLSISYCLNFESNSCLNSNVAGNNT